MVMMRQKIITTENLCRDRPLILLCHDRDFSVGIELLSRKKKTPRIWDVTAWYQSLDERLPWELDV